LRQDLLDFGYKKNFLLLSETRPTIGDGAPFSAGRLCYEIWGFCLKNPAAHIRVRMAGVGMSGHVLVRKTKSGTVTEYFIHGLCARSIIARIPNLSSISPAIPDI